jgi:hypothetical protein
VYNKKVHTSHSTILKKKIPNVKGLFCADSFFIWLPIKTGIVPGHGFEWDRPLPAHIFA